MVTVHNNSHACYELVGGCFSERCIVCCPPETLYQGAWPHIFSVYKHQLSSKYKGSWALLLIARWFSTVTDGFSSTIVRTDCTWAGLCQSFVSGINSLIHDETALPLVCEMPRHIHNSSCCHQLLIHLNMTIQFQWWSNSQGICMGYGIHDFHIFSPPYGGNLDLLLQSLRKRLLFKIMQYAQWQRTQTSILDF